MLIDDGNNETINGDIYDDELDPNSLLLLLLLSGEQKFSFHDLVRDMSQPKERVWESLQILQQRKYVKNENSMFMIDLQGVDYLNRRGFFASKSEETPTPKDFKNELKLSFFSSQSDLLTWLVAPLILLIPTIILALYFISGYTHISMERRVYQVSTWLLYLAFVAFYLKLTHRYIPEAGRLVVFRSGKAIINKGPGHVFLLPFIDNSKTVDMRERSKRFDFETCVTKDSILLKVKFFISWKIDEPIAYLTKVINIEDSMSLFSMSTLRSTIAQFTMGDAVEKRESISRIIGAQLSQKATEWGVEILKTEIEELRPPEEIIKQIENRTKAILESEATLIKADAEIEGLRRLFQVGSRIDDRTFNLYLLNKNAIDINALANYTENIPDTTTIYLEKNPTLVLFHLELPLSSLLPTIEFYEMSEETVKALDFIYSFLAIAYDEESNALRALVDLLILDVNKDNFLSSKKLYSVLHDNNITPLLISAFKYSSPISIDVIGIGTIIEKITGLIKTVIWQGKTEKQGAELDVKVKEINIRRLELENRKLHYELIEKELDLIEKGNNIKLPRKVKNKLLIELQHRILILSNSDVNPELISIHKGKQKQITDQINDVFKDRISGGGD